MGKRLEGKTLAQTILRELQTKVDNRLNHGKRPPGLAVIQVGENPASTVYVQNKLKACEQVGFYSLRFNLPSTIPLDELLQLIESLNRHKKIDGILIQLPLPSHLPVPLILQSIDPKKDVDGFHTHNLGALVQSIPALYPCTPVGILKLLQAYQIPLKGIQTTIVGISTIVGVPLGLLLLHEGATVTYCHEFTKDLALHVAHAELLISAVGKPDIVDPQWLKPGVIAIDVGIIRAANGHLRGDFDYEKMLPISSHITPVPGGVGPMTVACLLENTWTAMEMVEKEP